MTERTASEKKPRRVQQRALDTRDALLETAIETFSRQGYDGASVRQIEERAGVKRGLVAYHFDDKETLWRRAVDRLFDSMDSLLGAVSQTPQETSGPGTGRELARAFVTYSAEQPALNRLMMQESMQASWRVSYLVEHKIRPMLRRLQAAFPEASNAIWGDDDPHKYYLFIGAAAFVFTAAEECRELFGVSPSDPGFIDKHADLVLRMLFS